MCSHVVFVCDLFLGGSNAEASAIRSSNWAKWIIQFSSKMLHLLPVTKWQKGNRHKDEIQLASLSVFKVACVSSNASIRLFFWSKPVHRAKRVQMEKKTTRLFASVHVLLSPFPIQHLICSALQHAECQVAFYLLLTLQEFVMTFQWPFVAWGTATGFMMLYVNHLNHCLKWDLKIEFVEFMVE